MEAFLYPDLFLTLAKLFGVVFFIADQFFENEDFDE